VYEQIMEAVIPHATYILHIAVYLIKVNLIDNNIVFNKDYILFIINPEITVKGM
jgi:hypothetical protein